MNPCALWRCTGSEDPGGYSTVITTPSFPGISVKFFDISCVTFASFGCIAAEIRQVIIKSSLAIIASQLLAARSEEHTSELQSQFHLVCSLLIEKKKYNYHD